MTSEEKLAKLSSMFARLPKRPAAFEQIVICEHQRMRNGRYRVLDGTFAPESRFVAYATPVFTLSDFVVGFESRTVHFNLTHWSLEFPTPNIAVLEKRAVYRRPKVGRCPGKVYRYTFLFPDPPIE